MEKQYVFVILENIEDNVAEYYSTNVLVGEEFYTTFEEARSKIDELMPEGAWTNPGLKERIIEEDGSLFFDGEEIRFGKLGLAVLRLEH